MIWQRQLLTYSDSLEKIRSVIKSGFVLISEFDDDPDHWPLIKANKHLNFTGVHAVQLSTPILTQKIKDYNPEVATFCNCLEQLPEIPSNKWEGIGINKRIRIFFGALNRANDWQEWMKSLNDLIQAHANQIEVEVIHDRLFYDSLKTDSKRFTPTCNYKTYLERLRHCHIALLPLSKTTFNQYKSDLKFVEAAGCEVAAIANPTV